MYVYGGIEYNGKPKSDLYMFSFRTNRWTEIKQKEGDIWPKCKNNAIVNVKGTRMYMYGGYDGKRRLSELYYLDLMTYKWVSVPFEKDKSYSTCKYFNSNYF